MSGAIHVFGVRHLSPMGAWQLRAFLDRVRPEVVLVEGIDDATALLPDMTRAETRPPIAILAYTETLPVRTIVTPFATYSPEYQAIRWARDHKAKVEFFDLPSAVFLGLQDAEIARRTRERAEAEKIRADAAAVGVEPAPEPRVSLYQRVAEAAGERDYETYWERRFEHNANPDSYRLACAEFGRAVRELDDDTPHWRAENLVREAYMRRRVAETIRAGHAPERIVAVVGAFHASALGLDQAPMTDAELASLPRRPSKLTLMPYSYFKLSSKSGYGAGNLAPAYFELMWRAFETGRFHELPMQYLALAARHQREGGTHRSTAEVIDAVRLARTLSALQNGVAPTLADLRDAAITLLGHGEYLPIRDVLNRVDVGAAIGELPRGVSQTSIQADFDRELARLKLEKYRTGEPQDVPLDLRENRLAKTPEAAYLDLNRSTFFHRLRVLAIGFAVPAKQRRDAALWSEKWTLRWTPETEIALVESVLLGETVELAAAFKFKTALEAGATIAQAAAAVADACLCALFKTMDLARARVQELASGSGDFAALAQAARALGAVVRYGDVRRFDASPLEPLVEELFVQASLALFASATCDAEAAKAMLAGMNDLNQVSLEFHERVDEPLWIASLQKLSDADDRNPVLSGYACAILLERGLMANETLAREVSRRLSPGAPADLGAGWFEGLAMRNRYALLARQTLWEQLAEYVAALDEPEFRRALVFLRRAFGTFSAREKRHIAENLAEIWGASKNAAAEAVERPLDEKEQQALDDLNAFDFGDV